MEFLGMVLGRIMGFVISGLIFKLLTALGVGVVVFWGIGELFDGMLVEVQGFTAALPAVIAKIVAALRIDDAIQVIFSAISIRISLKSFGLGGIGAVFTRGSALSPP